MNRMKFSTIAHANHTFANPLSEEKINRIFALMNLSSDDQVLDVGCGNAELLIRLIERYGIRGVGVDPNREALAEGERRGSQRIAADRLTLYPLKMEEFEPEGRLFAAALCIGSSHAYGDYESTLKALKELVMPGGLILMGEGYWKQPPSPEYLEHLGATPDELSKHAENVSRAAKLGLTPLYSLVSSDDDWDHYEGLYALTMERYVYDHPEDPDSVEFRNYIRDWYDGYLRWGRDTLGFGLYLFRV